MYLSRIELMPGESVRPEVACSIRDAYGAHQLLWTLFSDGPDRKRDFLFRVEAGGTGQTESRFRAWTLSERKPMPAAHGFRVETRTLDPVLAEGDRLHFSVRVNPTVRHAGDERPNPARHDVVQDAKVRLRQSGGEVPRLSELVHSEVKGWLLKREEAGGFQVEQGSLRVDGYRQHRFRRPGGKEVRLSTVEVEGVLVVREPEKFLETWRRGLGPAKGFGCGLLMIRRA